MTIGFFEASQVAYQEITRIFNVVWRWMLDCGI